MIFPTILYFLLASSKISGKLSKTVNHRLNHHQKINYTLGNKSHFGNLYHSWGKGSVENAVGLMRRFLPKKTDFATVSHQQIIKGIETLLNNRPRKCLDCKTPSEIFNSSVALAG